MQEHEIDEMAVDRFALEMRAKLVSARDKGRHGWYDCDIEFLKRLLSEHIKKGDMRDVANIAMFIHFKSNGFTGLPRFRDWYFGVNNG